MTNDPIYELHAREPNGIARHAPFDKADGHSVAGPDSATLSIVIVTRHRPILVTQLLIKLIEQVHHFCGESGRVGILVSDSSRDDRTIQAIAAVAAGVTFCTVRRASKPFDTAEEHLYDALSAATGTYIWTLADDDLPTDEALRQIFALIERHRPDLVLINPPIISYLDGNLLHERYVAARFLTPMSGLDLVTTYREIIRSIGFIHLNCLISALVFRREAVMAADWKRYLDISPIYAHSMAFLEAFHDSCVVFTNRHIFSYRHGAAETNNEGVFQRLSVSLNVSDVYFWAGALARFLLLAVNRGFLFREDLSIIREVHWDGRAFLLMHFINDRLTQKLRTELQGRQSGRPLTTIELDSIETLFNYLSPNQIRLFERVINIARSLYPLILIDSSASDYGYDDLSREMTLFTENERDSIWSEFSTWGLGEIEGIQRDVTTKLRVL